MHSLPIKGKPCKILARTKPWRVQLFFCKMATPPSFLTSPYTAKGLSFSHLIPGTAGEKNAAACKHSDPCHHFPPLPLQLR